MPAFALQGWWLTRWRDNGGAGGQLRVGTAFLLGSLLWAAGASLNLHSDHVLRTLRGPGDTGAVPSRPTLPIEEGFLANRS